MRVAIVLVLALTSCVSARNCATSIPDDLRADAIRFALDRHLVEMRLVPRDDVSLALGAGTSYAAQPESRRDRVAPYAAGYASCILERVNPDRQLP